MFFFSLFKFTLTFYSVNSTQVLASEYSFIDLILTFAGYILNELFVGEFIMQISIGSQMVFFS